MSGKLNVLICGGGNGAHCYAGLASSRENTEVTVFTLFADEAQRWNDLLVAGGDFSVSVSQGGQVTDVHAKPKLVTKVPDEAAAVADVVILSVPAFAHAQYFTALKPFLKAGAIIVGSPGVPGFVFQFAHILAERASQFTLATFESLPWACRINEFGKKAEILGVKDTLQIGLCVRDVKPEGDPREILQGLLGPKPVLKPASNVLAVTLMSTNAYLHTSIMYGRWGPESGYDGKPVETAPLFYQGASDLSAKYLAGMSAEVKDIANTIQKKNPKIDMSSVVSIHDWYKNTYASDITDPSTLKTCLMTNNAYRGLTHPCVKSEDGTGVVPDYKYRYLFEDIPFGLAVLRGIGEAAGVATPMIDAVLTWGQECMDKQYLVDGHMGGKDVEKSRAPQAYGFTTLDQVLACVQ